MSDILILGYYGFKNSGDDALLLSVIKELRKQKNDIKLTVLSNDPEETQKNYGVPAVKRYNIFSILKNIITSKMLLVGGGTLIQDGTSTKSLMYYLFVIRLALLLGKKVMLYANGIGPLKKENYNITKRILNKVNVITLRESMSAEELKNIGVTKPRTVITADSAFNLEFKVENKIPAQIENDYVCVSVRNYRNMSEDFENIIADTCNYIAKNYSCTPVLIPFQKTKDMGICQRIKEKIKYKSILFDTDCSIEELFDLFSHARMCIGMRLHSLIYASICTVPSVGIVYDPKIEGFMEYMGQKRYVYAETLDSASFVKMVDECFEKHEEIKTELKINLNKMKKKAEENAHEAVRLLNE